MRTSTICPVCGKERNASFSSPVCSNCGFDYAYFPYFASKDSYVLWENKVRKAKENWSNKQRQTISSEKYFWIGDRELSYLDRNRSLLYVIEGNGQLEQIADAVEFSSTERNYAVLYRNGSVRVFGSDNEFGQKNTDSWKNIRHVLATPHCTYGIMKSGEMVYAGALIDRSVQTWNNIQKLAAGSDCLAALHTNGHVSFYKNSLDETDAGEYAVWKDIIDIAVSKDAMIGLTKKGEVKVSGRKEDPKKKAEGWRNVAAIAADNAYVYGITESGNVLSAGRFNKMLDRGRQNVSEWNNAVALSANKAGVGIVTSDGKFMFAGTITGDIEKVKAIWEKIL